MVASRTAVLPDPDIPSSGVSFHGSIRIGSSHVFALEQSLVAWRVKGGGSFRWMRENASAPCFHAMFTDCDDSATPLR
jgi:hypothetical protein